MSAPEQVFGPGTQPKAGGAPGSRAGGSLKLGKNQLMIGGAVAVVAAALLARGKGGGDVSGEIVGEGAYGDPGAAALNTAATDLYTELQPELEHVADTLARHEAMLENQGESLAAQTGALTAAVAKIPAAVAAAIPRTPRPAPKKGKPKPKPKGKKPGPKTKPKPKGRRR